MEKFETDRFAVQNVSVVRMLAAHYRVPYLSTLEMQRLMGILHLPLMSSTNWLFLIYRKFECFFLIITLILLVFFNSWIHKFDFMKCLALLLTILNFICPSSRVLYLDTDQSSVKTNDKNDVGNYRPISILSVISKVLAWKSFLKQVGRYLSDKTLLFNYQSGFRIRYSTETCPIPFTDYIIYGDPQGSSRYILFYLNKRFTRFIFHAYCNPKPIYTFKETRESILN